MNADPKTVDFFVAGGTLRPDAPSYVQRPADEELFNLAQAGTFCYILTTRQMGKSSLMTRTERRLKQTGVSTATLDLTSIGTVSIDAWYLGLLTELTRQLRLAVDLESWWQERAALGQPQRFTHFLRDVVLTEIKGQVVIFIDEIDSTLSLDFADDFFAAIRFTYNARAADTAYTRLTFVLLGVATPSDLIKDVSRTPFNIGQGLDLGEFSWADVQPLRQGLTSVYPEQGETILQRIFYWTNGHPYLTQKLCAVVVKSGNRSWTEAQVDELATRLFLSEEARNEDNLKFVQRNVEGIKGRQRHRLLGLYRRVYEEKKVKEDQQSLDQNRLKLFGLVGAKNGTLQVRNEIYRQVFDLNWIRINTEINWAPIITTTAILIAVLAIGSIIYQNWVQNQVTAAVAHCYETHDPKECQADLAKIFRLQGIFEPRDHDYRAKDLFNSLSQPEQSAVFNNYGDTENLIEVIQGLYVTLADVDDTGSTNPFLETMLEALAQLDPEETKMLKDEIKSWLDGRKLAREENYPAALNKYNQAIDNLNPENPATLYERAKVLIKQTEYQQALHDLDSVIMKAQEVLAPATTALPATLTQTIPSPIREPVKTLPPKSSTEPTNQPTVTPFIKPITEPTTEPTNQPTVTPTVEPILASFIPQFSTAGEMRFAVSNLINSNPNLVRELANNLNLYPNLAGLVPTPTPTSTSSLPTPIIVVQRLGIDFSSPADLPTEGPIPVSPTVRTSGKTEFVVGYDRHLWLYVCKRVPGDISCAISELMLTSTGDWDEFVNIGNPGSDDDCSIFEVGFVILNEETHNTLLNLITGPIAEADLPDGEARSYLKAERELTEDGELITCQETATVTLTLATIPPTATATPVPTATPTPRPALIVYVQSFGQQHDLGLVASSSKVINEKLHPLAAAPAWSPDGRKIAFYGEPKLSELGGIYAKGSGIYILEPATGIIDQFFSGEHIRNMDWAPDGIKLAVEIGPPDQTHQIVVLDTRDSQEISRFSGEQPTWSPNSQELVIKACNPECGLWKVGFDGFGGKLLTTDSTDSYPNWSSTGEYIVFTSRFRTADWEIYRLNVADGLIQQLTTRSGTDTTPIFSSDGREIYYRSDAIGDWQIRVMAVDGRNDRPLIDKVGQSEDWGLARPAVY